jgi:hypothetical protein
MRTASFRDVMMQPETEAPKPPPRTNSRLCTTPSDDHDDDFDVRRRALVSSFVLSLFSKRQIISLLDLLI